MELIKELQDGKLSDAGWEQYEKYSDYYQEQYSEYNNVVDFVAFIESDAKNRIEYDSSR